jgi:type II secretory pathway predicted ATPase ExeA
LGTLISALFYDLSPEREVRIPTQGEKRERELQELIKKRKRPVALFVDEAHDLHGNTLIGLKRLVEVIEDGGGTLSVVLAGKPKLRNDLRRPTMEEIGYRVAVFTLERIAGHQREYITWLLKQSAVDAKAAANILTPEAIDLLVERLRTPLQIEHHLTLALEEGCRVGVKPLTGAVIESVL